MQCTCVVRTPLTLEKTRIESTCCRPGMFYYCSELEMLTSGMQTAVFVVIALG